MAIHYTLDCTKDDPTLTEFQTRWAAEANRLHEVALDDPLTPQTMEPAGRTAQTHRDPTKHTLWHYPTTIHPEAVTQIKETLSLTLPDTHNAHQPGKFTIYWNFPTDTGMVPQVAEPPLPPTVMALAKAAQAMAHREGAPQDWTPSALSNNTPTTTPTKHSRLDAKYTRHCTTKTVTSNPTAHGWYTSYW